VDIFEEGVHQNVIGGGASSGKVKIPSEGGKDNNLPRKENKSDLVKPEQLVLAEVLDSPVNGSKARRRVRWQFGRYGV